MKLDSQSLAGAAEELAAGDPILADILSRLGPPPLGERPATFATLILLILEQQVSLASARAVFERLRRRTDGIVTAEAVLRLPEGELRATGFTRQKAAYGRTLAAAVASRELDLAQLAEQDDDAVKQRLTALPGIGPWTADVYLLMALGRPDVWPAGDLALARSLEHHHRLGTLPKAAQTTALAEPWRPWRSVAARLLWSDYLDRQARR